MTNGGDSKERQQAVGAFYVGAIFGFGCALVAADFVSVQAAAGVFFATWMLSIPLFYRS